jgi:hypothetical protein
MKRFKIPILLAIIALIIAVINNCAKVTGKLDDQAPLLVVNIEIVNDPGNTIVIDGTHKVYLIYYANNDWTNPWLTHGSATKTIFNPTVGTFSTFIAAFYDANGNGVVDPGEPCTGYENSNHNLVPIPPPPAPPYDVLTKLSFLPLEWRMVTITLDPAVVY